jgi:hypothetical protein
MKQVVFAAVFLCLPGCTLFQESHYSNHSTAQGNVVVATGEAAVQAARTNSTHNCPSCATENLQEYDRRARADYYNQYNNQTVSRTINRIKYNIEGTINRQVDTVVDEMFRGI